MTIIKFKKILSIVLFTFLIPKLALADDLLLKSLGHSSFLIKGEGKSILINPFKAIGCASDLEEPKEDNVDFVCNEINNFLIHENKK